MEMVRQINPRNILLLIFSIIVSIIFYGPLKELLRLSFSNELYSHIVMIPLVSAYFFYINKKEIFSNIGYSFKAGILIIITGSILYLIGMRQGSLLDQNDHLAILIASAVITWIGGFILFYGVEIFKKAAFPILFLFFLVPIPTVVVEKIILLLQSGSTEAAFIFFKLTGVPIFREGFLFYLSGVTIEVAKECSGIRSSIALLITVVIAGKLFLNSGWRRGILALSIFPIAIMKNGLRIVTLSLLAVYVDPQILASPLHKKGGILFFILGLLILWPILWILRKSEKEE